MFRKPNNDEFSSDQTVVIPVAPAKEDFSALRLYYEGELMVPRAIHIKRPDGSEVTAQRIVIEVTPMTLPVVVELTEKS